MEQRPSSELTSSAVYALLSRDRRRLILRLLSDRSTPMSIDELATLVSERENETETKTEAQGSESVRLVACSLHHDHLPRFDDADVVAYDPAEKVVRRGPNFGALLDVLTEVSDASDAVSDG